MTTPRMVRHPELLSGDALPLIRPGYRKLWWGLVPVVVVTVAGIFTGGQDWTMGLALLALWLVWCGVVWLDHRAWLRATDNLLEVRSGFRSHEVLGADVTRVKHQYQGRSPDFQIRTRDGRRVWVPASKLERGHSTFFTWLDMHAPQAELDPKTQWWHDQMVANEQI
ncbi:DUF2835 domain-containing protein [Aestuariimicrobium sp. p3-SID1156]|uniref:DUF2835 domain-containing protein n=1 Tax=Aestuariimicrobium sp. p3-SID1156 TaxID=2916038 RepID=UPI00223AEC92|nr:DUF2835 domain-containing protein [Aestuariimicrobium sp. p3-SID1156]MCT1458064.1 DUF2835 domain-containing protein [Aestuariimicrobium sp. p3-SID1156]